MPQQETQPKRRPSAPPANRPLLGSPLPIPDDPMEELVFRMLADTHPNKANLTVGAYRTDAGKPYLLEVVRDVEQMLAARGTVSKEYLPFTGMPAFTQASAHFVFGKDADWLDRTCTVQTLSGTGALRIGGELLRKFFPTAPVYLSNPSWVNHKFLFQDIGFEIRQYRYFDQATRQLDFEGMLADLNNAPEGSIIILHACAHNPTGIDPTLEQWTEIANVVQSKRLFAFFDCAYQGYATGDPEQDAAAIRLFARRGLEIAVAQSYSKIAGLYGERVGALSFVCADADMSSHVASQLKSLIRLVYLSPPTQGARIMATIFADDGLVEKWLEEIKLMVNRIETMRTLLVDSVLARSASDDWASVSNQKGMFAFTPLTPAQVDRLEAEFHIYMTRNGRISLSGLTNDNITYVADAIAAVSTTNATSTE